LSRWVLISHIIHQVDGRNWFSEVIKRKVGDGGQMFYFWENRMFIGWKLNRICFMNGRGNLKLFRWIGCCLDTCLLYLYASSWGCGLLELDFWFSHCVSLVLIYLTGCIMQVFVILIPFYYPLYSRILYNILDYFQEKIDNFLHDDSCMDFSN
jgi:hypothetical protein